ncbi:Panacea domain-containing protein [Acetobacter sp. UBA5411]|uniref:Panacea domain-containing protein n=1 Tax=Acetobacter sp. UBA5411 TaxID=1945905 RepID=UPI0025BCCF47|nr:type II toxin-antitoxin system antitoxin SocA domain-containing protein [Acetobacter sp. UBA5411]
MIEEKIRLMRIVRVEDIIMGSINKIDLVCDYIITKLDEASDRPSLLKIQKLLYYVQAWHLALHDKPMFNGKFQAWVHGPVNRHIYDRFKGTKLLYSHISVKDVLYPDCNDQLTDVEREHIDEVLENYGEFSGAQLERLTHTEAPWLSARGRLPSSARCEVELDEKCMKETYRSMLK